MILYTILAYNTQRTHQILCESYEMLERICALRFRYTLTAYDTLEPNWGIQSIVYDVE